LIRLRRLCGDELLENRFVQVRITANSWKQSAEQVRNHCKNFRPTGKCVGHSLKLLDIP